jgi:hypothetical protein
MLQYEAMDLQEPGRLLLLCIPDLIRDPEGRRYGSFKKRVKQSEISAGQPGLISKKGYKKSIIKNISGRRIT